MVGVVRDTELSVLFPVALFPNSVSLDMTFPVVELSVIEFSVMEFSLAEFSDTELSVAELSVTELSVAEFSGAGVGRVKVSVVLLATLFS